MDRGSDGWENLFEDAISLHNAGMYRKALPKFKSALAMAEKAGDDRTVFDLYGWIIVCHLYLEEVSRVECERIAQKLTFLRFLSMRKCCVCVTRRNR